eukprot:365535-Chlamydomonas_euryale.AAC.28
MQRAQRECEESHRKNEGSQRECEGPSGQAHSTVSTARLPFAVHVCVALQPPSLNPLLHVKCAVLFEALQRHLHRAKVVNSVSAFADHHARNLDLVVSWRPRCLRQHLDCDDAIGMLGCRKLV